MPGHLSFSPTADAHHAEVVRHAVLLAVEVVEAGRGRIELVDPAGRLLADVLDEAGVGLLLERAAAPRLEDVRRLARLHVRGQLGLERLVLEDGDLDRDVGMCRVVLGGGLLPDGLHRIRVCHQLIVTGLLEVVAVEPPPPPLSLSLPPQAASTSATAATRPAASRLYFTIA
jgi:hypothetical protein